MLKRFGRKQPSKLKHKVIIMSEKKCLRCWICGELVPIGFDCIEISLQSQGLPVCIECVEKLPFRTVSEVLKLENSLRLSDLVSSKGKPKQPLTPEEMAEDIRTIIANREDYNELV